MSIYIGIDVGTSGCRACAIDQQGEPIAQSRTALPAATGSTDGGRQDTDIWWQILLKTLDHLTRQLNNSDVHRIAIDATSATVLLCNSRGEPQTPALMYNDARSRTEADRIKRIAPPDSAAHGATSSLAKLLYLRRGQSGPFLALHQADWLSGKLTGNFGISDENNALKMGYDPVARRWPDWLGQLDVTTDHLPLVVAPGSILGPIKRELAVRWNWPATACMVAGTTDSTAGFIATGAAQPGTAVTSLGSTLVVKVLSDQPVFSARYGVYSHRLGDRWLAGGASNAGGAVLRKHFGVCDIHRYSRLLHPSQPTGLDYYPLAEPGERFPVPDPAMQPRLEPRPANDALFFQAILEGLARIEKRGYDLLAELGAPYPQRVLSVGGGAVNRGWKQIRQRLLKVPVSQAAHREAAYGAALLARGLEI